jgi:hypothetical protein
MTVYHTLGIAGFVALSGTAAIAQNDGAENQAIRDDIYNGGYYGRGPVPFENRPYEGRAAVVGPPPEEDLEPAPPPARGYYRRPYYAPPPSGY